VIKQIITDEKLLSIKSEYKDFDNDMPKDIKTVAQDLLDTALSEPRCLGLAANQIGELRRIFVFKYGDRFIVAINPNIIEKSDAVFPSYESCLSRPGREPVKVSRHKRVKVAFIGISGAVTTMKLAKRTAVEFQHEMDHLDGVLI